MFGDASHLQQVTEQPYLEGLVAMNGERQSNITAGLPVHVVAPLHPQQRPAMMLQNLREPLAGNRPQTAISKTRSPSVTCAGDTSTDRHPSTAS